MSVEINNVFLSSRSFSFCKGGRQEKIIMKQEGNNFQNRSRNGIDIMTVMLNTSV